MSAPLYQLCRRFVIAAAFCSGLAPIGSQSAETQTVALWLFDEQIGIYPSCVLGDAATGNFPLVIGPGGKLAEGKYGNALTPCDPPSVTYPPEEYLVGLAEKQQLAVDREGAAPAMTWLNNKFCGLMTRGERHLRQEVNFGSPTHTALNLGDTDWTVEFWLKLNDGSSDEGVVFEIGAGPRGANRDLTQLLLAPRGAEGQDAKFVLVNGPSETQVEIPTQRLGTDWTHYALVYDATDGQLKHFVNGRTQSPPAKCQLVALPEGDEDYMSVGRDANWQRPLPGAIDELRVSTGQVYTKDFEPPTSFSKYHHHYAPPPLASGPPLLFGGDSNKQRVVPLEDRKHLFIDDAIVAQSENVEFAVNPPRPAELVLENEGFSNHVSVFEDVESKDGLVRLYFRGPNNCLVVWVSEDGVKWRAPDLGREYEGLRNVVITDPVGLGSLFVDPNAPKAERTKYFSGYRGRGSYVYSSPDGYTFTRNETSALPFRGASQSLVFYDDQRQVYAGYHRSDMYRTAGGKTERSAVMTETKDVMRPWPFAPVSQAEQTELGKTLRLGRKNPYYVDNGPVTPPGFGVEYPRIFAPDEALDEPGVDIYVPKCEKYAWAPDTYVAFPLMYYHYDGDGPPTRRELGEEARQRGSGPLETQMAVSRDGVHWRRYPRPAYVGIGRHGGVDVKKNYLAHGMVRRGDEIWQYYVGSEQYHSPWTKEGREVIFRVVQRFDGFVSADFAYTGGEVTTKPLTFSGNRLVLNVDTDATGRLQVGLLDEQGAPIEGFSVDDCVYINADETQAEVEWLKKGSDLSALAGKTVQVVFRGRGTKLYTMQFVDR